MKNEDKELARVEPLKMVSIKDMESWYKDFVQFTKKILKKELDYGVIPGVEKPSLFKPGAEKLRFVYKLQTDTQCIDKTIDPVTGFIDYTYKTTVKSPDGEAILATCEGSANSYEDRYLYRYVSTDKHPSKEEAEKLKAQGVGKWRKFGDKWVWVEKQKNAPEVLVGIKNTIQKMAQKRSFVGAILIATGASEFFTQDVEDMNIGNSEPEKAEPKPEAKKQDVQEGEVVTDTTPKPAESGEKKQDVPTAGEKMATDSQKKWITAARDKGQIEMTDNQIASLTFVGAVEAIGKIRQALGK